MKDTTFRILVLVLLLVNTFFIGSMWCAMKCGSCANKSGKICPLESKAKGKICPITGKVLQADSDGSVKGLMAQ